MYSACFAVSVPLLHQSPLRSNPLVSRRSRLPPPCAAQVSSHSFAANLTLNSVSSDDSSKTDEVRRSRLTALRKQIEFWFSSANLKRDWYLRRQMNEEGWLDPSIFLKFNLIKRLNASLSDVVTACGQSDILEVSTPSNSFGDQLQQTRVRKAARPLQNLEEEDDDETARSIIAENVPQDSTCESIREIFSRYGQVTYVWLPRKSGDAVRGYALISFESPGAAARAISEFQSDQQKGTAPEGIAVKSKADWELSFKSRKMDSKVLFVKNIPAPCDWRVLWDAVSRRFTEQGILLLYLSYRNDDNHCFVTVRNQEDADKAIQSVFNRLEVGGNLLSASILSDPDMLSKYWASAAEKMSQRKQRSQQKSIDSDSASPFPPGVIVKVDGLPDGLHWRYVLDALKSWGDIVFLRYSARTGDCFVRFISAEVASTAAAGITGSYMCEYKVTAEVLADQEEEAYWANFKESRKRRERRAQLSPESMYGGDHPSGPATTERPLGSPRYVTPHDTAKQTETLTDDKSEVSKEGAASKLSSADNPFKEELSPASTYNGDDLSPPEAQEELLSSPEDIVLPDVETQAEMFRKSEPEISEEGMTSKLLGAETALEQKLSEEPETTSSSLGVEETVDLREEAQQNSEISSESSTISESVQVLETPASAVASAETPLEEKLSDELQNANLNVGVEKAADLRNEEIQQDLAISESTTIRESSQALETPSSTSVNAENALEGELLEEPQNTNINFGVEKTTSLRYEEGLPNPDVPSESTTAQRNAQVLFMEQTSEDQDSTNGLSSLGKAESPSASADQEPAATSGSHL